MRKLLSIRNNIEHNDASPPELERCKESLDVIWYFWNLLNNIVQLCKGSAIFQLYTNEGDVTQCCFSVDLNHSENTEFRGWFPEELLFYVENNGTFKAIVNEFQRKEDLIHIKELDGMVIIKNKLNAKMYA